MKKRQERYDSIMALIRDKGRISIKELARIFDVSELTVRRDVQELEAQKRVQNVRGIIFDQSSERDLKPYNLNVASTVNFKAKNAIGMYAAKMIEEGDSVIIDNGTTTARLAAYYPEHIETTVLCCNLNIVNHLFQKSNISLVLTGGYFHAQTQMFESNEGVALIKRMRATKAFISAAGVHNTLGVTCKSNHELKSKREMINASMEKILLVDSSKFGKLHKNFVCEIDVFDKIITDSGISEEWMKIINSRGIECIVV